MSNQAYLPHNDTTIVGFEDRLRFEKKISIQFSLNKGYKFKDYFVGWTQWNLMKAGKRICIWCVYLDDTYDKKWQGS